MDRFFPLHFLNKKRDVAETIDPSLERRGVGIVKADDLVLFDQDKTVQMVFTKFSQMTEVILVLFFQKRCCRTGLVERNLMVFSILRLSVIGRIFLGTIDRGHHRAAGGLIQDLDPAPFDLQAPLGKKRDRFGI